MADIYGFYLKKTPESTPIFELFNKSSMSGAEWRFGYNLTDQGPYGAGRNNAETTGSTLHLLEPDDEGNGLLLTTSSLIAKYGVYNSDDDQPAVDQYYLMEKNTTTYNPSTDGAVSSIRWSETFVAYSYPSQTQIFGGPVIEQGGKIFVHGSACPIPRYHPDLDWPDPLYGETINYHGYDNGFADNPALNTYPISVGAFSGNDSHTWWEGWQDESWRPTKFGGGIGLLQSGASSPTQLTCTLYPSDFLDKDGNNPDFSSSGGEIKFGLRRTVCGITHTLNWENGTDLVPWDGFVGRNVFYKLEVTINPDIDSDGDGVPDHLDPDNTTVPSESPSAIIDHTDGPLVIKFKDPGYTGSNLNYDGATSKNLLRGNWHYNAEYQSLGTNTWHSSSESGNPLNNLLQAKFYLEGNPNWELYDEKYAYEKAFISQDSKAIPGTDEGTNYFRSQYEYNPSGPDIPDFAGAKGFWHAYNDYRDSTVSGEGKVFAGYLQTQSESVGGDAFLDENNGLQTWWPEKGRIKKVYFDLKTLIPTQGWGPWLYGTHALPTVTSSLDSLPGANVPSWNTRTVDISAYAGKRVKVIFHYVQSDSGTSYSGDLQLDDINIDGTNYSFDSSAPSGWETSEAGGTASEVAGTYRYFSSYDDADFSPLTSGTVRGRWNRDNNGTPSGGTGMNTGNTGSYYLYAETSTSDNLHGYNRGFFLRTAIVELGSSPTLSYAVAQNGSAIGDLNVYLSIHENDDGLNLPVGGPDSDYTNHPRIYSPKSKFTTGLAGALYSDARQHWHVDANFSSSAVHPERYWPKQTTFCILQDGICYRADLLSETDTVSNIGSAQHEARLSLNRDGTVLSVPEIRKNQWVNLQGSSSSDTGISGAEAVDFNNTNIARLETVDGVEKRYFLREDFKDPWGSNPNFGTNAGPILFGVETLIWAPRGDLVDDDGRTVQHAGVFPIFTAWSMEVVYDKQAPEGLKGDEIFGGVALGGYSLYPELEKGRRYKIHLVKDSEWTESLYQGFEHSEAFFQRSPKSTYDSGTLYDSGVDKGLMNYAPGEGGGYYGTIIFDVPLDAPKVLYLRGDSTRDLANWDEPKDIHGVRANVARYNSPDAPTDDPVIQGSYDNAIGPYRGEDDHLSGVRGHQGGTLIAGQPRHMSGSFFWTDFSFMHVNAYSAGIEPNSSQPGYGVQDYTTSATNLYPPETMYDGAPSLIRGFGAIPKGNAVAGFYPRNIFMSPHKYHTGAAGLFAQMYSGLPSIVANMNDGGVTEINYRAVDCLFHEDEPANRKHRYKEGEYFGFLVGSGGASEANPITKSQITGIHQIGNPFLAGDFTDYQDVPLKYELDDKQWGVSWIGTEVPGAGAANYAYGYNAFSPQLPKWDPGNTMAWQAGSTVFKRGGIYIIHFIHGGGPVYLLPEYESIKNSIYPTGGDFSVDERIGSGGENVSSQRIIAFQKTSGTAATHTHPGGGPNVGSYAVQPTGQFALPYVYGYNPDNIVTDGMTYNVPPFMSYEEFSAMSPTPQGGTSLENYEKYKFKLACHGTLIWSIPYDMPDRIFLTTVGGAPLQESYLQAEYTGTDANGDPTFIWHTIPNLWGSSGTASDGTGAGSAYGHGRSIYFTGPTTPPTTLQAAISAGQFPEIEWSQDVGTTEEANTVPLIHESAFLISEASSGGSDDSGGGFGDGPHDSDQDGILDSIEGGGDTDQDGLPDYLDTDSDDDTIPDAEEGLADTDGDGIPDRLDTDSDDDGIPDSIEGTADTDGDGIPDRLDPDSDDDTIPDAIEGTIDPQTGIPVDTDQDGTPDYLDTDSDDDSLSDEDEGFDDSDGDGIPDYLDPQTNIKIVRPNYHPDGVGDFTSLQAWADYAAAQSHAAQWAEVHKGFQTGGLESFGSLDVQGWSSTPNINSYPRVYVSPDSHHGGDFNRAVLIMDLYGASASDKVLTIGVSYFRIEGIMSSHTIKIDTDTASNVRIDSCIVSAGEATCFDCCGFSSNISSAGNFITNCLSIGHLAGTESSGPDIGYKLGGEEMYGGGVVQVFCINCSSYDQFGTGYQVMNHAEGGGDGGGDVILMNSIACDANGSDFTFSVNGTGGNISTSYNLSSDDSALNNSDHPHTHLILKPATDVWLDPRRELSAFGGFLGHFGLKTGSPAIDAGGFNAYTPTTDIRGNNRIVGDAVDMGAYEYIEPPIKAITLFIPAEHPLNTTATLWTSGRGDAQPLFDYMKLMLLSQGDISSSISLMTGGPIPINASATLFTSSIPTKNDAYLYTSGKIITFEKSCDIPLFTLANGVTVSSDLIIGGCAGGPFPCPSLGEIEDDPYLPLISHYNPTLYVPGESRCFGFLSPDTEDSSAVKPRYLLEDNANDSSASGYNWSVTGTLAYTENKAQGNKALLFPNGSTYANPNYAKIDSSNNFFDSSGDGIAVSFWIKRISDYTSSPSAGAVAEGIIAKGSLRAPGPNIAGINGDWGIFKTNDASEAYPNIVFYANVDDASIENTINCEANSDSCDVIGPQGFSPETGSWYFVMYWIDAKNKQSYFRYVKAPIFTGNSQVLINTSDAVTHVAQKWTGNLQRVILEGPGTGTEESLWMGVNNHGVGGLGLAIGSLGEIYGDSWAIDDVIFSNQICSKSAMEDVFNRSYLNFLYSIISNSSMSLYIPGPPEHTGYNEEDLL